MNHVVTIELKQMSNKNKSRPCIHRQNSVPFGVGTGSQEGGASPSPTLTGAGGIYK